MQDKARGTAVPGILRLGGREQEVIPLRRDADQGCFSIDYIPLVSASKDHQLLLHRVFLDRQDERTEANFKASWMHMIPALVADEAKAALDLATERMGSENEFYGLLSIGPSLLPFQSSFS